MRKKVEGRDGDLGEIQRERLRNSVRKRLVMRRECPTMLPTCSSEVGGETRRSRIEGGGKGKLSDLLAGKVVADAEDSRDSGGGEIGN